MDPMAIMRAQRAFDVSIMPVVRKAFSEVEARLWLQIFIQHNYGEDARVNADAEV